MSNDKKETLNQSELLSKFDHWLLDDGPVAIVIREPLEPVEGRDGVFFPSTYAPSEDKKFIGGYNIDIFPDGTNICLIDSVGSQANRIEPIFGKPDYQNLAPQVSIVAGQKTISLLEAGHRAGDAIVRCTAELKLELQQSFKEMLDGNAEHLARIAPTSLVFGVWDSRDTQAKLPRLVSSTIRAFNVKKLTRSATYLVQQQVDYTKEKLIPLWESDQEQKLYSKRGYLNALASASHGGVMLSPNGKILRDVTLSLAALRRLSAKGERTQCLQRYILGLSLIALTARQDSYLRQGCNLVPANEGKDREFKCVYGTGKREDCLLTHSEAKDYAEAAAKAFVVGPNRVTQFDRILAENDIAGTQQMVGSVISVDGPEKKFFIKIGGAQEILISTDDKTKFKKGKSKSTFELLVIKDAELSIEVKDSVATAVKGKN